MQVLTPKEEFYEPSDPDDWRLWLAENHTHSPGVWLIYLKKGSGRCKLAYAEAVEEALCFGWIDSKPRKLDTERTMLRFTPRKPGSVWSRLNKQRVERLLEMGLMAPAGMAKVEAARRDGSWETLDPVDDLLLPADLTAALAENPAADRHFADFSPSARKMILGWVLAARRPETRAARIRETVACAARNVRANLWQPKSG